MYAEFKITTWERVYVPDGKEEEFLKLLKAKEIESANDMFTQDGNCMIERIDELDEQMSVDENGGYSTIEVFNKDNKLVFSNGEPQFKTSL